MASLWEPKVIAIINEIHKKEVCLSFFSFLLCTIFVTHFNTSFHGLPGICVYCLPFSKDVKPH